MRAIQIQSLTGPEGLALVDVPEPEANDGLLIDVHAAGVSFADLLVSQGLYQMTQPPPFVPGMEASGIVRQAPPDSNLSVGDRVCTHGTGTFVEVIRASPEQTFRLPDSMSFEQGAGFILNFQTAMFALRHRGGLGEGETVLVFGASGGVGTAAIQVAKGLGAARVIGLVSTPAKAEIASAAGADDVVLISDKWKNDVLELSSGVDLVYDPVGGDYFLDGLRCLKPNGRLVVVGFAAGSIPEVRVNRLLLKNIAVVGAAWGSAIQIDRSLPGRIHDELMPLIESGAIDPPVGQSLPLEQAADALRLFQKREAVGKVVLRVAAD